MTQHEQKAALTPDQILEAVNPPTDWSEVNTFMLVNFLKLPPQNQKDLIQSIFERQPELFPETNYWKTRCELAEKLATSIPIDMDGFDASSAPHHRKEYQEFLKNNKQP